MLIGDTDITTRLFQIILCPTAMTDSLCDLKFTVEAAVNIINSIPVRGLKTIRVLFVFPFVFSVCVNQSPSLIKYTILGVLTRFHIIIGIFIYKGA
jgi:hypothetical protein